MKPQEFASTLTALAEFSTSLGGERMSNGLRLLASIFQNTSVKTVAGVLKKSPAGHGGPQEFLVSLTALRSFAAVACAKGFQNDLAAMTGALERSGCADIDAFVTATIRNLSAPTSPRRTTASTPVRDEFVRRYVKQFEEHLGDDGFAVTRDSLDSEATTPEVVAVAKAFTTQNPRGRAKALSAIWARHQALMDVRAKTASRAGRSAA